MAQYIGRNVVLKVKKITYFMGVGMGINFITVWLIKLSDKYNNMEELFAGQII
jgi:hypothetical protein